jgi:arylsulfatase A-like enzyme
MSGEPQLDRPGSSSRRTFLQAAGAAALPAPGGRMNVLVLLTDQQSNFALGANGNRYVRTPAMDALAARGVSFRHSYCTYPRCSPARSSLWTGRAPHETGVVDNSLPIAPGIPTLGEVFERAGYTTMYGGKWHLPKPFEGARGFRTLIGGRALASRMDEPLAGACVEFLRRRPKQPFLLAASFMNPHDICEWIRRHPEPAAHPDASAYPPAPANLSVSADEPEYIQLHRKDQAAGEPQETGIAARWRKDDYRAYLNAYYGYVEDVDRQIGRVLAALRETGLEQNTLVVFTSDHGEGMGAHGWVEKGAFWEETMRVPLVISVPGSMARGVVDGRALVSGMDLLPTLCDYAGIPAPAGVHGASLRPALEGRDLDREYVTAELYYQGNLEHQGRMIRSRRYKYVCFNMGARPEQLFDLERDPGEGRNLAAAPEAREVLLRHRNFLKRWLRETGDEFVPPVS